MGMTHFDENGNARMVDVGTKKITSRTATASGFIKVSPMIFNAIKEKNLSKGDVLTVATTAGIMGAKKTSEIIPMCHIIPLTHCSIKWEMIKENYKIKCICTAKCNGQTGVEMEALTGVSTALLTVYDMCKAIDHRMIIEDIHLLEKDGGKSGHFIYTE